MEIAFRRSACLVASALCLLAGTTRAQIAKGATKFLGNITHQNAVRSDFGTYWNQITAENECKWGIVESSRDNMSWSGCDAVYNYARQNGIPFKFHTLVWGSQYPSWLTGLSQADQLAEITEWMDAVKSHYPDADIIDVVNEAVAGHNPAPFKAALGGDGTTGYDWIVTSFKMARARWPKAKLVYNDYNVIRWDTDKVIALVKAVRGADSTIIDALGCQSHGLEASTQYGFAALDSASLRTTLKKLHDQTKLPIFISEYDVSYDDDATQKTVMSQQFPVMWTSEYVAGVTIWGYIYGQTWSQAQYSGLIRSGSERPALVWLKDYVKNNPKVPNPFETPVGVERADAGAKMDANRTSIGLDMRHMRIQFLKGGRVLDALGRE